MRVSRSDRQKAVFVLKWADVERLIASISSHLPIVALSTSCIDKLDRTFSTLEELKSFRNSERSAITEFQVIAFDESHSQRLSFSLNSDDSNNVRLSLDADETVAIQLNDFCEDFLSSIRPWYSWIAKADWLLLVFGFWFVIMTVKATTLLLKLKSVPLELPKISIPTISLVESLVGGFFAGMLPLLILILIERVRRKYFPTGTFAFGDGENRHASTEVIRTVLIVAFGVSVVSSVMVAWFQ